MTASGRLVSDRALAIGEVDIRGSVGNKDSRVCESRAAVKSSCVVQYVLQFKLCDHAHVASPYLGDGICRADVVPLH